MTEIITVERAVTTICELIEEYCETGRSFDEAELYTALKNASQDDTAMLNKLEAINSEMCSTIIHLDAHIRALEAMQKVKLL